MHSRIPSSTAGFLSIKRGSCTPTKKALCLLSPVARVAKKTSYPERCDSLSRRAVGLLPPAPEAPSQTEGCWTDCNHPTKRNRARRFLRAVCASCCPQSLEPFSHRYARSRPVAVFLRLNCQPAMPAVNARAAPIGIRLDGCSACFNTETTSYPTSRPMRLA